MSDNPLEALPAAIGNLQELKSLRLSSAKLSTLPENICMCHALEYLELWETLLISLPSKIGNLRALKKMHLDSAFLEEVPESMGNLESLIWLFLDTPRLTTLPGSIPNLSSLKYLCIGGSWGPSSLETQWQESKFTLPTEIKQVSSVDTLSAPEAVIERNAKIIKEISSIQKLEVQSISWQDLPAFILDMPLLKTITVRDGGDTFHMGKVANKFATTGGLVEKMDKSRSIIETLGPGVLHSNWGHG